jgi:hypothetical protein
MGYREETSTSTADLICRHPITGERWIIEAKGRTTAIGLDFRTGLGQILQAIADERSVYALAVPALPEFLNQTQRVNPWVRRCLNLHWLVVSSDGKVSDNPPDR